MKTKSTVKSWNEARGFGFIVNPDRNGEDIFIHFSGILGKGRKQLFEGEPVEFETKETEKGTSAINLVRLSC